LESKGKYKSCSSKDSSLSTEHNNTLPIKPSAYIGAMVENSLPKLKELVKEGELEQEQRQQAQKRS
jgi:hypothetical protein